MRRLLAMLAISTLVLGGVSAPTPAAAAGTCRVRNTTTGARYVGTGANLQAAIDEASTGDTLAIKGICVGHSIVVGSELTLLGVQTERFPDPTLDAAGTARTLTLRRSQVEIRDLTITGGATRGNGGGIYNQEGLLVLAGTTSVVANRATSGGGGILNKSGVIRLEGSARVVRNRTGGYGGGVANWGGTVIVTDSAAVLRNRAGLYGGGGIESSGAVRLFDDALVAHNRSVHGGGIAATRGVVTVADSASILGNVATTAGGGLEVERGAAITLRGSARLTRNVARVGGGVMIRDGATLTLRNSASITSNSALDSGGGIAVKNKADAPRVYLCSGRVAISPNDPDDPPLTLPCS